MTVPGAKNRISAVLFDLGGTLVDNRDFPALEEMAGDAGVHVDADTLAHWTSEMRDENDREGETWTLEQFWRRVLEGAVGQPVTEEQWSAFFRAASTHPAVAGPGPSSCEPSSSLLPSV